MIKDLFGPMEFDALGEMMNISLGSSATAVSNMLEHRVDITTPKVSVVEVADFEISNLEPAMGVEIKYVEGLDGSNIMLLRKSDVKVIVDILMGSETPEEEFELNELTISAVCEVMNQMMGAAATALSDFLGFPVNISTPTPFELDDIEKFKREHLPQTDSTIVTVGFALKIENALESEFMNVMTVSLAKELLKGLGLEIADVDDAPVATAQPAPAPDPVPAPAPAADSGNGGKLSQEEIERLLAANSAPAQPAPAPSPAASSGGMMSQEEIERMLVANAAPAQPAPVQQPVAAPVQQPVAIPVQPMQQPMQPQPGMPPYGYPPVEGAPYGYPPPMYYPGYPYPMQPPVAPDPKLINATPVNMQEMQGLASLGKEQSENLELIMEVPLQISVEIGRTRRKVQDILEFAKGSLVVLDKLAGDQVDLFVNGKCIARGDVVVVDDNFGVRITEIVQKTGIEAVQAQAARNNKK